MSLGKLHPVSSSSEGARGRRRVAWLALGSAILFLGPAVYVLRHDNPTPYQSQGNYALVTSAVPGEEDVRLSVVGDEAGSVPPSSPPTAGTMAGPEKNAAEAAKPHAKHDQYYCGFLAQAMTGNITPEQAARRERTSGAIMGAMGGAVLGALFGGSSGHSGQSGAAGASAGLVAGIAMSSNSARRAADNIRSRYDAAYSWCMNQKDDTAPEHGEARS